MGQQQLLLLVLATVVVGLATVAGIQAFDEGRSQATQDALQQRALSIGADINAALQSPSQLGGVSGSDDVGDIAAAAGYDKSATGISADGAGGSAKCEITKGASATGFTDGVTVTCAEAPGSETDAAGSGVSSSNQIVVVEVSDDSGPTVAKINGQAIGS